MSALEWKEIQFNLELRFSAVIALLKLIPHVVLDILTTIAGTVEPKEDTQVWPKNVSISLKCFTLISVFLRRDTKAWQMQYLLVHKQWETKGKGAKQNGLQRVSGPPLTHGLHSPSLWVTWSGSWEAQTSRRMDWGLKGLTYGITNMLWCAFTSCRSTTRKEKPAMMNYSVILKNAHCTELQEPGDAQCNLPHGRWGAPGQRWMQWLSIISNAPPPGTASDGMERPSWEQWCRYKAPSD